MLSSDLIITVTVLYSLLFLDCSGVVSLDGLGSLKLSGVGSNGCAGKFELFGARLEHAKNSDESGKH